MRKPIDIISHPSVEDDTITEWGVIYEDGAVEWHTSEDEAEFFYDLDDTDEE